jgi:hypothetical protein
MIPESIRAIIRRAAKYAMKNRRGRNRRRVYMETYLRTRRLAIAIRKAK